MFKRGVVGAMMVLGLWLANRAVAQNVEFNYEGRVRSGGVPFDGNGQFKFAVVSTDGTVCYWSNDGVTLSGNEPTSSVPIAVSGGFFSVIIGDESLSNMALLDAAIFNTDERVRLRVWFSDGVNGFQQLSPDRPITNPALIGLQSKHELTIYVNPVTGNDRFAGNKPNKPKKTIQAAWDALPKLINTTATIQLAHGEYYEALQLSGKVVAGDRRIVIVGNPNAPDQVRLLGAVDRATSITQAKDDVVYFLNQPCVRLEGMRIEYGKESSVRADNSSTIEIRKCILSNSRRGLVTMSPSQITISDSTICDSATGPAMEFGLSINRYSFVDVVRCSILILKTNQAVGALASKSSQISLTNSTIDGYRVGTAGFHCSVISFYYGGNIVKNCQYGCVGYANATFESSTSPSVTFTNVQAIYDMHSGAQAQ